MSYFRFNVFLKLTAALLLLCGLTMRSQAQSAQKEAINKLIHDANSFNDKRGVEKLYLQTDKDNYIAGDTLWFKAYLFDALSLTAPDKSGLMYVELTNDSNKLMLRGMIPVYGGLTFGNITLDSKDIPQGSYTLRAYTSWMLNFGEEAVFRKQIYVSDITTDDWLVDYNARIIRTSADNRVSMGFRIKQYDLMPVGLRQFQLRILDDKRTALNDKLESSVEGLFQADFNLPEKLNMNALTITLQDLRKGFGNRKLILPLQLNRPENTDLQFMPEGGALVADLPNNIAFKALNEDGSGEDVSGKIFEGNTELLSFNSLHQGMGSFTLNPRATESYTARMQLPDGSVKTYQMPVARSSGVALTIGNEISKDSLEITLRASADIIAAGIPLYLMAQSRGAVCYGASLIFRKAVIKLYVSKRNFPSGVTRFSVLGTDQKVLNERVIFIDHRDQLTIQLTTEKELYVQRDSIRLNLKVTDQSGAPVQGSFSLAVTDDGQVKTDSIKTETLISHVLLSSDLKGNVEDPGYYVAAVTDQKKWRDLDLLLLTQGWVGYTWADVYSPEKPMKFPAEPEFQIRGKYTNLFNKPIANARITLLGRKPMILTDTTTNAQGRFTFSGLAPGDSASYFIEGVNQKGKKGTGGLEVEEFTPPVFKNNPRMLLPWYVNTDTTGLLFVQQQQQLKSTMEKLTGKNMLKEVKITGKKVIRDSKNLNGPGGADITIDEETLQKAKRTSLGDLLAKNIPGFGLRMKKGNYFYGIGFSPTHIIMDGMEVEKFKSESESLKDYIESLLRSIDAEDIKGIEVMKTGKNQLRYISEYLDPMTLEPFDHYFIEITTRGGHGLFFKKPMGVALLRPLPPIQTKLFYAPKYPVKSRADMTDIRATIFWAPHVVTDKSGNATITFYAADNPGSYSLRLEGSDMNGNLGIQHGKLKIVKQPSAF